MFGNQFMEYVASPLLASDGTVYFVSNLGLVAAIDARVGTIRWIHEYPIVPLPHPQNFHPRIRELGWYANAPFVHESTLLVTPLDADSLLAFDTDTGDLLWSRPREGSRPGRGSYRSVYALGLAADRLVLAGSEVLAVEVDSGQVAWVYPFDADDEEAFGLGIVAEDRVYCPTRLGVHQIDAATGKRLAGPVAWERPKSAGNLLSFRNLFLSTSAGALSIYFRWEEISRTLLAELEQNPDAVEIHLKLGDGYTHAGDLSPAQEHYAKALELSQNDARAEAFAQRARKGLYRVYASLGESAWRRGSVDIAADFYANALAYAHDDESLVTAYLNFETLYRAAGDTAALRSHYQRMLADIPAVRFPFLDVSGEQLPVGLYALLELAKLDMKESNGPGAVARFQAILTDFAGERLADGTSGDYAKEQIDFLVRTFGKEVYAGFEREAQERFAQARRTRNPADFEAVLASYPNSSLVEECLLEFSRVLQDVGDYPRVLEILRGFLRKFPGSTLVSRVFAEIESAYRTLGYAEAARYAASMHANAASRHAAVPQRQEATAPAAGAPAATLAPPLAEVLRRPFSGGGTLAFVEVNGTAPDSLRRRVLLREEEALDCLDLETGELQWKRTGLRVTSGAPAFAQDGRLYVATVDDEVVCFDPETGESIWTRAFEDRITDMQAAPGTILVVTRQANRTSFVVTALDVLDGAPAWWRHVLGNCQLSVSEGLVYLRMSERGVRMPEGAPAVSPQHVVVAESFTGSELHDIPADLNFRPVPAGGRRVLVAPNRGRIDLVDAGAREQIWTFEQADPNLKWFYLVGGRVAARFENRLVLFDASTGKALWERPIDEEDNLDWIPGMEDQDPEILYFKLRRAEKAPENELIALRAQTGEVLFEVPLPPNPIFVKRLLRAGPTLVVQVTQYKDNATVLVLLIDAERGELLQQIAYEGSYYAEMLAKEGDLCLITGDKMHLLRGVQR